MSTTSIWSLLAEIKIGTLFAWTVVIISIIAATIKGIKSVYAFISKYNDLKENNEKQTAMLKDHEDTLKQINDNLNKISKSLDEQKEINLKYVRHIIVEACHAAIVAKGISLEKLASIEEMYEEYVNVFHGNSYVSGLVKRVRTLPMIDLEDDKNDSIQ